MRTKILVTVLVLILTGSAAFSQGVPGQKMFKGSVGSKQVKLYGPFYVLQTGTAVIQLIYDNPASDLDLAIGTRNADGSFNAWSYSGSGIKNFETLEAGLAHGTPVLPYYIFVVSIAGTSPYHLTLDCTCILSASPAAAETEAAMDQASERFVQQLRKMKDPSSE